MSLPPPNNLNKPKKRGKLKKSKERNLLERILKYEEGVLRFMKNADVPFTNNSAEKDQRMSKVQQKISGCFRSMEAAKTILSSEVICRHATHMK